LPSTDLSLSTITIKEKFYEVVWSHFIANFDSDNTCSYALAVCAQSYHFLIHQFPHLTLSDIFLRLVSILHHTITPSNSIPPHAF